MTAPVTGLAWGKSPRACSESRNHEQALFFLNPPPLRTQPAPARRTCAGGPTHARRSVPLSCCRSTKRAQLAVASQRPLRGLHTTVVCTLTWCQRGRAHRSHVLARAPSPHCGWLCPPWCTSASGRARPLQPRHPARSAPAYRAHPFHYVSCRRLIFFVLYLMDLNCV